MKLNDKDITELAENYLYGLYAVGGDEFNSIPLAFKQGFKKCQSMSEWVDCNDFRNFIRTHHLSHLWDKYCKNNSIEPTPPIK